VRKIEILLCEDHAIFRDGIKSTLEGDNGVQVIAEAENGEECLTLLETHSPHIILMDINMPVMDGIACLKEVKSKYPDIKVIALTQYDEKRFVKQMLKNGASGYLLKSTSRREMMIAFKEVLNGRTYIAEEASNNLQDLKAEVQPNNLFPDLSDREKEIIKMLCSGLSSKQIGDAQNISHHTVESHRSNIFKKIEAQNIAGLVKWAVSNGFD
jgi:DNA-binding NarL/FixJ family response regulator